MSPGRAAEPRVFQIVAIAAAACLRCGAHLRDSSLLIRADGGLRCKRCSSLSYGVFAPAAGIVILTLVTVHELRQINELQRMDEILAFLGITAPFVPQPVLAEPSPR